MASSKHSKKNPNIAMACSLCQNRNYEMPKPASHKERLSLRKYCPRCNQHTEHLETK